MEEVMKQGQNIDKDKTWAVALDIEAPVESTDKSSGNKALSRRGSSRMERKTSEEQELEEALMKSAPKSVNAQLEPSKQQLNLITISLTTTIPSGVVDSSSSSSSVDGRGRRFNHFSTLHPRKIPLIFASLSSMVTMILIYFTLAINRRGGT